MKLLVFLSAVAIAASTQRILLVTAESYDDGQYHPDPSEDDGQYHPSADEGEYHDDLGDSGQYVENGESYKHLDSKVEPYKHTPDQLVPYKPFHDGGVYKQSGNAGVYRHVVDKIEPHQHSNVQNSGLYKDVSNNGGYKQVSFHYNQNQLNQGNQGVKGGFYRKEGENDGSYHSDHSGDYKPENIDNGEAYRHVVSKIEPFQHTYVQHSGLFKDVPNNGGYKQVSFQYNQNQLNQGNQGVNKGFYRKEGEDDGSYHPDHSGDYKPENVDNGEAYRHVVGKIETYKQNAVQPVPSPFYDRASYQHGSARVGYGQENNLNNQGLNVLSQISTATVNNGNSAQNLNVENVKPIQPAISPKYNSVQNLAPTNLRNDDQDDGSYHHDPSGDYKAEKIDNGEAYRHVVGKIETYKQNAVQPVPSKPFYDRTSYQHVSARVGYNQENNLNNQVKSANNGFIQPESKLQVPVSLFGFGGKENNGIYKHENSENKNNVFVQNQGGEGGRTNFVSTKIGSNVLSPILTTTVNKDNSAQNLNVGNVKPIQPVISPKYNNGQNLAPTNLKYDDEDDGSYHHDPSGDYKPENIDNGEAYRHVVGKIETYKQNAVQPVPSTPFYDRASYQHVSAKVGYNQENNLNNQGLNVQTQVSTTKVNKDNSAQNLNVGNVKPIQPAISPKYNSVQNLTPTNLKYDGEDDGSYHHDPSGDYKAEKIDNGEAYRHVVGKIETYKQNAVQPVPSPFYDRASYQHGSARVGYNQENNLNNQGLNVQTQVSTTNVNKDNSAQNLNVENVKPIQPAISPKYNSVQNLAPTNLKNDGEDDGSYHHDPSGDYKPENIDNGEAYRHVVGKIETSKQNAVQQVPSTPFYDRTSYQHVSARVGYNQENNLNNQGSNVQTQISTSVNKDNFAQNLNIGGIKPIQPAISPKYNSVQNLAPTNLRNDDEDDGSYHHDPSGDYKPEKIDNGEAYRHIVGKVDSYRQNPAQPVQYKTFNDRLTYEHVSTKVDNKPNNNLNNDGRSVVSDVIQHSSVLQGSNLQSQINAENRLYQAPHEKQIATSKDNIAQTFSTVENMKQIHAKIQSSILSKYNGSKSVFDGYQSVINRKTEEFSPNGYHYVYQNENGVIYEEEGHVIEKGTQVARLQIKGFYSFHGLDQNLYTVEYTADSSNGYLLQYGKVVKITTLSKGAQFCIQN